jgi:hypothetical protein
VRHRPRHRRSNYWLIVAPIFVLQLVALVAWVAVKLTSSTKDVAIYLVVMALDAVVIYGGVAAAVGEAAQRRAPGEVPGLVRARHAEPSEPGLTPKLEAAPRSCTALVFDGVKLRSTPAGNKATGAKDAAAGEGRRRHRCPENPSARGGHGSGAAPQL